MDINDFLKLFKTDMDGAQGMDNYNSWLGYLYAHSSEASAAYVLNDIKQRAFQPSCLFRDDWATNLPPGLQRPLPAENAQLANASYNKHLECLARPDGMCNKTLIDMRARFFEPGCQLRNPADPKVYRENLQMPFK